ncbi:hypothetical protein MP228_003445 [Amoeboaphelidium protococcarum]|nr:hypothetical protein MP228_003445 [Amoeboaphelidium protococcarum]
MIMKQLYKTRFYAARPTSQVVSIIPLEKQIFDDSTRNKPTRSGYMPANDRAYDEAFWTDDLDRKLIEAMESTLDGQMLNYDKVYRHLSITDSEFSKVSERDIRVRWSTYLRSKKSHHFDKFRRDVKMMKQQSGRRGELGQVTLHNGRYVLIPHNNPSKLKEAWTPLQQSINEHVQSVEKGDVSSMSVMSRLVADITRTQGRKSDAEKLHKTNQTGSVHVSSLTWTHEEDMLLLEGVDSYNQQGGDDGKPRYDKIAIALKSRNRSEQECRERVQQLMRQISTSEE